MSAAVPVRTRDHPIRPESLNGHALTVVDTLKDHGFDAYLVGGCVRDLLCGQEPKDFDVATNATPEEVRELFRRARLVGRRFPIAHVRFGRELIEVSTFRQGQIDQVETNATGLIMKDRVFGTMAEDAFRRDFTVNALYYDPDSGEIIDYVNGLEDIEAQRLQFIGETRERLAEDPVRMLRAIRFGAKLGFTLDPELEDYMEDTAERLEEIPGARLFDEFLKMFLSGYGAEVWLRLRETPLARSLFPTCNPASPMVLDAMRNTDQRVAEGQPVTPGFLVAVLLWDDFQARNLADNPQDKPGPGFELAMDALAVQQQHIAVPRRYSMFAREVWQLQPRLMDRQPRNVKRVAAHRRFRAAFDFMLLRGGQDKTARERAEWWQDFQDADPDRRDQMIDALPKGQAKRRRRRGGNRGSSPALRES